jgi:hypothetical protein
MWTRSSPTSTAWRSSARSPDRRCARTDTERAADQRPFLRDVAGDTGMNLAKLVSWILVISGMLYLVLGLAFFFIGPMTFKALSFGYAVILILNLADLFFTSLCAIGLGVLLVDIAESPITRMHKWLEFNDGWLSSGKMLPSALEITAILWFVTSAINHANGFYAELQDGNVTIVMTTVLRLIVLGSPAFAIALLLRKRVAHQVA